MRKRQSEMQTVDFVRINNIDVVRPLMEYSWSHSLPGARLSGRMGVF